MRRAMMAQKHRPPPWVRQPDGKLDALKGARPVWGGGWRNGHIVRCVPRSVPTPRDPTPSPEDVLINRQIVDAGKLLDVEVLDDLVLGRGRFVSMREKGLGFTK
jgi:hypothetical protein